MYSQIELPFGTLTELFLDKRSGKDKGIFFVKSKSEEVFASYEQIFTKALTVLGYLQSKGHQAGDLLIFQVEDPEEFIHLFWGCVLGGIIPVPIVAEEKDEHRRKLFNVLDVVQGGAVIGKEEALPKLKSFAEKEGCDYDRLEQSYLDVEEAFRYTGDPGKVHLTSPDDTAFIQFSSGSTGMPKGVVLTHRNLITNMDAIIAGAQLNPKDTIVSWMPLTHDMGLIGCHLAVTAADMMQCLMETKLFVMRPALWLDKITEHKATILSSPNFGLKYSMIGLERSRRSNYDFSSVRLIFNGAEPISVKVCDEFLDKTAAYGMKRSVMFPVYGMAEASLAIAFPQLNEQQMNRIVVDRHSLSVGSKVTYLADEADEQAAVYVDEGYPVRNCEFRIADEEDRLLGEDTMGYIHIRGGNVSGGYYDNAKATRDSRTADGWFRTGDMGFMCRGRIVVIGRSNDMLIINGQNYFANDLERLASEVDKVELNKVAVCSVRSHKDDQEKVALFAVHKGDDRKFVPTIHRLRAHFARSIGIALDIVLPVNQIPKTSSGKLMRFALRERLEQGECDETLRNIEAWIREDRLNKAEEEMPEPKAQQEAEPRYDSRDVEAELLKICQDVSPDWNIGLHDNFFEHGVHSLALHQIAARIDDLYPGRVKPEDFFSYSSIVKLARYIGQGKEKRVSQQPLRANPRGHDHAAVGDIAIIGMAANLPGAANLEEFWGNLAGGVESVGPLPHNRRIDLDVYLAQTGKQEKRPPRDAGYLHRIDSFDYEFFRIMKREAIAMSPSQRLFLETAYTSMEHAGYGGEALRSSRTGVYVGYISDLDGYGYQELLKQSKDTQTPTGVLSANISGRLSYFMDFTGPSLLVDSACSSSMSALNLACQGIRNGDCDQAIVGGVQLKALPIANERDAGIESSDGHTRPFAEDADGTGEGEGVVSILIKPLDKAVQDGDQVYAVIKATHSNQDGHSVGLSAPNPEAQSRLIREAMDKAGVKAEEITYMEAHGTGTKLGDPIEVQALIHAFRAETDRAQFCAIGSVKSNIGHLYASSGLASVIKCSLMLERGMIPATVNIRTLNSRIPFDGSPFYVNLQAKAWKRGAAPRRCGISNFGFSGTNCHTILEEYMEAERSPEIVQVYPFVLSAPTREGLKELAAAYYDHLKLNSGIRLADICYTAAVGRGHYAYRMAMLVQNTEELARKLENFEYATETENGIYVGSVRPANNTRKVLNWGELTADDIERLNKAMRQTVEELGHAGEPADRMPLVRRMCELYTRGAAPAWEHAFSQDEARRVSLPTYRFQAHRCWPQFETAAQENVELIDMR
ncbi:beta-ketoacyl synthase N-terminal-like domain-containing protein [Paenibacillus cisolokensis]|uniref:beta-ketoacyl synthase N-terminal-like domain-containing protein n=1 Tax=Paenibacillus cisolokensis TaxID=1658519 RepID=UPI003D2C6381